MIVAIIIVIVLCGDPDFVSLHKAEGIRILEPRKFS